MYAAILSLCFFLIHCLGAVLIYLGVFLYPGEEARLQNRIDQWWNQWWPKLDSIQKASRSRVAAFMQGVATVTGRGFDRIFGARLLSLRVILVSIYLSLASLFLLITIMWPWMKYSGPETRHAAVLMLAFFLALAITPAITENRWVLLLWWAIVPVTLLSMSGFIAFVFKTKGSAFASKGIALILLVFGWSLLCDLGYIALTRFTLRRMQHVDNGWIILLIFLGNLLACAVPLLSPIYVGLQLFKIAPQVGAAIFASLLFNSIDVLAGFAAALVAVVLLVHRLSWPILQRPLHAMYRFSPLKQKRWLVTVGLILLFLPRHLTVELVKSLIEKAAAS